MNAATTPGCASAARDVDPGDPGVRHRAAQDRHVQHARAAAMLSVQLVLPVTSRASSLRSIALADASFGRDVSGAASVVGHAGTSRACALGRGCTDRLTMFW